MELLLVERVGKTMIMTDGLFVLFARICWIERAFLICIALHTIPYPTIIHSFLNLDLDRVGQLNTCLSVIPDTVRDSRCRSQTNENLQIAMFHSQNLQKSSRAISHS